VKALDNIEKAKHLPEARKLLVSFVERMPSAPNAYVRPRNFEFVTRLKSELKEYLNN
jgi:hypothetical protein